MAACRASRPTPFWLDTGDAKTSTERAFSAPEGRRTVAQGKRLGAQPWVQVASDLPPLPAGRFSDPAEPLPARGRGLGSGAAVASCPTSFYLVSCGFVALMERRLPTSSSWEGPAYLFQRMVFLGQSCFRNAVS